MVRNRICLIYVEFTSGEGATGTSGKCAAIVSVQRAPGMPKDRRISTLLLTSRRGAINGANGVNGYELV